MPDGKPQDFCPFAEAFLAPTLVGPAQPASWLRRLRRRLVTTARAASDRVGHADAEDLAAAQFVYLSSLLARARETGRLETRRGAPVRSVTGLLVQRTRWAAWRIGNQRSPELLHEDLPSGEPGPERRLVARQEQGIVVAAILKLPPKDRAALCRTLASKPGPTSDADRQRVARVRRELRRTLAEAR